MENGGANIVQEMDDGWLLYMFLKHTNFDMLVSPVEEPLINLITEAESVVFDTEVSNHLQLISGQNLQEGDRNY